MEVYADIVRQYAEFAAYAGDSPCFESWARAVTEDPDVVAWLATLPPAKRQPNLVFAAARWHGVPAPGPYAGLRDVLLTDDGRAEAGRAGPVRETILVRATQTNEVGRLATLVPFLGGLGEPRLSLVEVGASAGLCLYPDRWSYVWSTDSGDVTAGAGDPLRCEVAGPFPASVAIPEVAWRGGVDLNPLDVADRDAMEWLTTLVWPEQNGRRERLVRAIEVAQADPPRLVAGDLLDRLPSLVEEASAYGPVVVFHTAVIAYLEPADRAVFQQLMAGLVAERRCHWISNEAPNVLPDVSGTGPTVPDDLATFVLGVDGVARAWTHPHGASLRML